MSDPAQADERERIVRTALSRFKATPALPREDLEQEAYLALLQAEPKYGTLYRARREAFLVVAVRRALYRLCVKAKRAAAPAPLPANVESGEMNPVASAIAAEEVARLATKAEAKKQRP